MVKRSITVETVRLAIGLLRRIPRSGVVTAAGFPRQLEDALKVKAPVVDIAMLVRWPKGFAGEFGKISKSGIDE